MLEADLDLYEEALLGFLATVIRDGGHITISTPSRQETVFVLEDVSDE